MLKRKQGRKVHIKSGRRLRLVSLMEARACEHEEFPWDKIEDFEECLKEARYALDHPEEYKCYTIYNYNEFTKDMLSD